MDTSLDSLDPRFKPFAFALLARHVEARIPVFIVNTRRTAAEQADALARHVSRVQHSAHQDGLAIDIVPYQQFILHGMNKALWNTDDPIWFKMGQIGEALSLSIKWGGRFKPLDQNGLGWDPGHFEYVLPTVGIPV